MLTLMTAAPFQVTLVPAESSDLAPFGDKIKASVLYHYDDFKTMSEEDIVELFSTSLEIFASYYTDICQNYYPAIENSEDITASASSEDPLAAALGSKQYRATEQPLLPMRELTRTNPLRVFLLTLALITKMKFLLS